MDLLNKNIQLARLKVAKSGQTYIVYKTANGYSFIQRGFRKGAFEAILTKKNDNVIVKDKNGKLINTYSTIKKESKPKKESAGTKKQSENKDKKEDKPSSDKTL